MSVAGTHGKQMQYIGERAFMVSMDPGSVMTRLFLIKPATSRDNPNYSGQRHLFVFQNGFVICLYNIIQFFHARQIVFKSKGSFRILLPVRSKMAFVSAGEKGGSPGSPTPPATPSFSIICNSTGGASVILGIL